MTKKITVLFLFLFITVLNAGWVDINENTNQKLFEHTSNGKEYTEINFSLDGYNSETINERGNSYQKISYSNEGNLLEVGKPDLPKITRLISIPDEGIVSFEIINTTEEIIQNINIYPTQKLRSESDNEPFKFVIDEEYYAIGNVFPVNIIEVGEPVIMRGQRLVSVSVNPFQYDPQTKELKIITNVDLVVNASGRGGINPKVVDMKKSRFFEPIYRSSILNYETTIERDAVYQDPSYLFIYPDNATILANLEYLADWKRQKGFEVALASTADTGNTFATIKAYIQDAYDNWVNPPEFVCLVGDADGIFTIPTDFISYYSAEGDHSYSQLEGGDILADVILGRISISSIADLQTYVTKVLNYEKEPFMLDTDWYNKSLMVGDPSTSGQSTIFTNQSIVEMMQENVPNIVPTEIYSGSYSTEMTNNLNSGVSYFNYRGWLGMSSFYEANIDALTNFKMLPFAVILTCATGTFEGALSHSEAFIRAGSSGNPTGAIASIGTATTGTHTNFNNCVDAGIYHGLFADGIHNPGGAVNRGKLALYEHYPQNPDGHVDNFSHMNTLMGDPGVELWTGVPQTLIATYDTTISPGTNYLEVNVTNNHGLPLEGAWVTAYDESINMFATGYTDENGNAALEINANDLGTVNLTVTNHNYIPHLGSFDVANSDRFINVFEVQIDDAIGNNDGIINPGEDIGLDVSLKNFGSFVANSVTATITTENDFVTITDGTETFGAISAGSSVYCADDFDITIDADALGGSEIIFNVIINDALENTWNDIIYLVVEGANLDAVDYTVFDVNGFLDPGETVQMDVTIQNNGIVTANAVSGVLSSSDSRVTVSDANGYFGNVLSAGGQASNTLDKFSVTANAQLVVGTQILMELQLTNADGYDSSVQFLLGIGEVLTSDPVGPDAYGYFCYDDGDTGYVSAPVYDWIEINSIGTNLNLSDAGETGDIETINSLPITFRMYGEEYDSATVCSNGWIAPGGSTQASFMNSPIPGPQGPSPMIAPFWDDLDTNVGNVYWYYDSTLQVVIIEWDHMRNDLTDEETFQVILYDADLYPTNSGDSQIKFQYKVINNTFPGSYPSQHGQYASVGIEDHMGTVGLEYTFNNSYPDAAKHLQNELALFITTSPIPLGAPFLALGNMVITDANGNGQIDYNEDIDLDIDLNNLGDLSATGITAVLSTTDSYITITVSSSSYNDITDGGSGVNLYDYEFTVAEDCPDGHIISFDLTVTSNEDTWQLNPEFENNAPNVEYTSVFVDDSDNHLLDPGETCNINVTFTNNGGADVSNADVVISESDTYLTLNTSTHDFGTFLSGQSQTAIFNVTVSSSTPEGHSAIVDWEISGDYNYTTGDVFRLAIGFIIEDFETGDFSAFPWSFGGDTDWTIDTVLPGEGIYSAKSGAIIDDQTSEMALTVEVAADGEISFFRKISSENNYDKFRFYIDEVLQEEWSGEVAWSKVSYPVVVGNRTFKWQYDKDNTQSSGEDCAWIDYFVIGPSQPIFELNPALIEFGDVIVNTSSTEQFTISNEGGETLTGSITTPTGYSVAVSDQILHNSKINKGENNSDNVISYSIPANSDQTFDLVFSPVAVTIYTGDVVITSNDTNNPTNNLNVTGNGFDAIQIGNGINVSQHLPIEPNFGYSYTNTLYLASEFGTPGADQRIEKIWYNYHWSSFGDDDSDDWIVYMGVTESTSLTNYLPIADLTEVFNGDVNLELVTGDGWLEIELTNPFHYNPAIDGNLVIGIDENTPSWSLSGDDFYCDLDARADVSIWHYSDSINSDPAAPETGTLSAYYPNTRFEFGTIPEFPVFNITPDTMDFGTVYVNNSTGNQTFTISNLGAGAINVSSVSLTGTDTSQFTLVDTNLTYYPIALTTNSMVVDVSCMPTSVGVKNAFLTVVDDLARATHNIPLIGEGAILAQGVVCSNPLPLTLPAVNVTGNTVDYGDDYDSGDVDPSSSYLNGDDVVYQFTTVEDAILSGIIETNGTYIGAFILSDCPNPTTPPTPVILKTSSSNTLTYDDALPAGTYFLIISSWPAPQAIDYDINLSVAPLGEPANVLIVNDGTNVTITWDAVTGADSYVVYSSTDPYSSFTVDATGVVTAEQWVATSPAINTFYHVAAVKVPTRSTAPVMTQEEMHKLSLENSQKRARK